MSDMGIWQISGDQLVRLQRSQVQLEKRLEDWIENDPTLLQHGLIIVGRQVHCAGGFIDLLAIDPYTQSWVVIEIKRGKVRRETIMQGVDYAASIDSMSDYELRTIVDTYLSEKSSSTDQLERDAIIDPGMFRELERSIAICVVGTGHDADLERMVDYLAQKYHMDLSVIEFEVFAGRNGELSLLRQLTTRDVPQKKIIDSEHDIQRLFSLAEQNGIGEEFRLIYEVSTKNGLFPRTYRWSIMYTPPEHRGRCLVVAWVKPAHGKIQVYAIPETFAEYFPISEDDALDVIGTGERKLLNLEETVAFCKDLQDLFDIIAGNSEI